MMMENLPFNQVDLSHNEVIREFSQDTDSGEFTWHRDREDRRVKSLVPTDWKVQLDNQLPVSLNEEIFIPMGVWHRVIKGTGDLRVKVIKLG